MSMATIANGLCNTNFITSLVTCMRAKFCNKTFSLTYAGGKITNDLVSHKKKLKIRVVCEEPGSRKQLV